MPAQELKAELFKRHFAPDLPARLGVAVSGGSDSLALLHLLNDWRLDGGPEIEVVSVNHGLREAAASEISHVRQICAGLGVTHSVLDWSGWDGRGNLMDQARRARYDLIAAWARERQISDVLLGHTLDDQAETLLMRLARGSGVDGLSAMPARSESRGILWHRPLLGVGREDLRDYLRERDVSWCEDPTNQDSRYDRVQTRELLRALAPLGLSARKLAQTADRMAGARVALDQYARQLAPTVMSVHRGDIIFDSCALAQAPDEVVHRLLNTTIRWISGADYGPRAESLARLRYAIETGDAITLNGCQLYSGKGVMRLTREFKAVQNESVESTKNNEVLPWDTRWQVEGPWEDGMSVRALGDVGWRSLNKERERHLPYRSALASPAVWRGDRLIAAPLVLDMPEWQIKYRALPDLLADLG